MITTMTHVGAAVAPQGHSECMISQARWVLESTVQGGGGVEHLGSGAFDGAALSQAHHLITATSAEDRVLCPRLDPGAE